MADETNSFDDFLNEHDDEDHDDENNFFGEDYNFYNENFPRSSNPISWYNATRELPVYKKAWDIGELTNCLIETFDKEKDILDTGEQILNNAYIIGTHIFDAEFEDSFIRRMERAVLIKIAALEILRDIGHSENEKLADPLHLDLLRAEMDEFRKLFNEWVKSFDPENDEEDDWAIGFYYREVDINKKEE